MCNFKKIILLTVNFQNGKIKPGEEKSLESACFLERGSHKKLVGVSSSDMLYSGYVTKDPNYNTFLLVQTEGSKKVFVTKTTEQSQESVKTCLGKTNSSRHLCCGSFIGNETG